MKCRPVAPIDIARITPRRLADKKHSFFVLVEMISDNLRTDWHRELRNRSFTFLTDRIITEPNGIIHLHQLLLGIITIFHGEPFFLGISRKALTFLLPLIILSNCYCQHNNDHKCHTHRQNTLCDDSFANII